MACWKTVTAGLLLAVLASCGRGDKRGGKSSAGAPSEGTTAAGTAGVEAFWNSWRRAVAAGDGRALWKMTCASNRRAIVDKTRNAMGSMPDSEWKMLASMTGQDESRLRAMPAEMLAEETTVSMLNRLRDQPGELEKVEKSQFLGTEANGDRAVIRFRLPDGREMSLATVQDEGEWRADLEATARSSGRK
jgi:hypothetical protein